MMKRMMLVTVGFLACPCHFPLWLALLGGSAVGGMLAAHQTWILIGMTVTFVVALGLALHRPGPTAGSAATGHEKGPGA